MAADLRYPIGPYVRPATVTPADRGRLIDDIAALPAALRAAVVGLDDRRLDTPYRPGGWTVRQVVHHLADSHINAICRIKLALTESAPTIKPYDEAAWAELADSRLPIEGSLRILDAVHERWVAVLRSLAPERFATAFHHPESGPQTVDSHCANYAWHGRHHTAHITGLRTREGW